MMWVLWLKINFARTCCPLPRIVPHELYRLSHKKIEDVTLI